MNIITRYKWPVIVAAGLHGALFLSFPPDRTHFATTAKVEKPVRPSDPPVEIDMREPEEPSPLAAAGGAVNPLPELPNPPPRMDSEDIFKIAVDESTTRIRDVVKLPDLGNVGIGPYTNGPGGPGGPIGTLTAIDLDRVPRTIAQPSPDYPYSLKHDGIDGSVTVEFIVATDGSVVSAEAVKWTRREFVDSAVKAVLRWRFEPGTVNGRKVRFRMAVPIEFNAAG